MWDWAILSPVLITAVSLLIVGLERLFPYDRGQKLLRDGFWMDLVLYGLVQSYVLGLLVRWIVQSIDARVGFSTLHLVTDWPIAAQVVFFLVLHDLYIYCFHRFQHNNPILWRTHEAHHSVREVDWVAGARSHATEIVINGVVEFAPIVMLGAHPDVVLIKATISACWGNWIHSNVDVRTGWLQRVINGPEMHRWHHASELEPPGVNFGTKLAIWDWLFGTAYLPAGRKPRSYGLHGVEAFPKTYIGQFLAAFR